MDTEVTRPAPRRRRFVLSIRALMVVVLLMAIGLGWIINRARTQRKAVEAVQKAGGFVVYDWQDPLMGSLISTAGPKVPRWCLQLFGPEFFQDVVIAGGNRTVKLTDPT